MQFRRTQSIFVTLLLGLTGAATLLAIPAALRADMVMKPPPLIEKELRTRAAKADLRTSSHGTDPDTVWIGHIADATTAERVALSAHGVPAAGYGPFKIGRGPNKIVGGRLGTNAAYNGVWDFDHLQAGEADSLMGWWPFCFPFQSVGPSNLPDVSRPWFCLDYGNQANYVIPQGSPKRTFGVVGIWHRDPGNTSNVLSPSNCTGVTGRAAVTCPFGPDVEWTPIGGTCSAWCGLRALHDNTVQDNVTKNYFNQSVLEYQGINNGTQTGSLSTGGTDTNFPGYGSQWDQLMYRDIDYPSTATGLYIQYSYRTNMDTRKSGVFNSQAGWFSFDPHGSAASPATINGMPAYISANNAVNVPVDSFMVYIGKPVEPVAGTPPNDFTGGDNALHELYDAVRPADPYNRWFSEVVDITSDKQLQSTAGVNSGTGVNVTLAAGSVPHIDLGTGTFRTRLVFRVKTNRGFDDEDAFNSRFSSQTEGAALVDDVVVKANSSGGTVLMSEDFESAGAVDNTQPATSKWRSTGKPPQPYFHLHDFAALGITDPCGAATAAIRFCNSYGKCASPGDHDNSDKPGGGKVGVPNIRFNKSDAEKGFMSPTINLMSTGTGDYNAMGIDGNIAGRRIVFQGDQTYNIYNFPVTGNGFRYFMQAYPARQPNRNLVWGQMRKTSFFNFITTRGCFETVIGVPAEDQLIRFSGAAVSTHPDSFRVGIEAMARCYTLNLTDAQCSPSSGANSGGPYDNLTIGLAIAPTPPAIALVIWDLYNDAFPTNPTNQIATPIAGNGFDTTTAYIRTGRNESPNTGISPGGANARHNVPADTCIAEAPGGNGRLDLVFRILPGVGNYVSIGNRTLGLARVVTASGAGRQAAGNVVTSGDTTFWGQYMANNGEYGTPGGHSGNGGALSGWDANVWNSARCDTLETNLFSREGFSGNLSGLAEGYYASMYHESDPKFVTLGIRKNRCFLQDKLTGNGETQITEKYVRCAVATNPGFQGNDGTWPPDAYLLNASSGLPAAGAEIAASGPASATVRNYPASARGETFEYTQILPDGLFTPGTHIEYFFRKSTIGNTTAFDMGPDTNFVFPQPSEVSFDYKRWQEFSILPDRWKDNQFAAGGQGPACMLVVDLADRNGDERVWVSVADTIGLTSSNKWGAHNGWHAAQGVTVEGNVGTNNAVCVRPHGGQPGTVWDFFQTKAGESNVPSGHLGSRYANEQNAGVEAGKFSRLGPTQAMLLDTYKTLVWLNADLAEESVGPFIDGTDDDVFLLHSFTSVASPNFDNRPRGLVMYGTDLRGGAAGTSADLVNFFNNDMQAGLAFDDYRQTAGAVQTDVIKLYTSQFNIVGATPMPLSEVSPFSPTPGGTGPTYGVYNPCFLKLDVLAPASPGQTAAKYENIGATTAAPAAVYANEDGARDARTYLGGWTYGFFGGMGTAPNYQNGQLITALLPQGTQRYMEGLLTNIFGSFNCKPSGSPVGVGQDPASHGSAFVNFLNLRSDNPMRSGEARIAFGLAKTEKVEIKVYDVSGRLVKTLANRIFPGGLEHVVIWDGTNDGGSKVARGVYFYQLRSPSFVSQKKLAVLKN